MFSSFFVVSGEASLRLGHVGRCNNRLVPSVPLSFQVKLHLGWVTLVGDEVIRRQRSIFPYVVLIVSFCVLNIHTYTYICFKVLQLFI